MGKALGSDPSVSMLWQHHFADSPTLQLLAERQRREEMAEPWQMDTLGIELRASRMLSGCDTITPRAFAATQHAQDIETKDAGNTELLVCACQWAWCQILRATIVSMATRVDMEESPLQSVDSAWGTWCNGITSAPHAEGLRLKSKCVHVVAASLC